MYTKRVCEADVLTEADGQSKARLNMNPRRRARTSTLAFLALNADAHIYHKSSIAAISIHALQTSILVVNPANTGFHRFKDVLQSRESPLEKLHYVSTL